MGFLDLYFSVIVKFFFLKKSFVSVLQFTLSADNVGGQVLGPP